MASVSVFSKIPNLCKDLRWVLPNANFHEILSDADERLKSTEILVGDPDLFGPLIYNLPKIKWIQGTWAGVDKLLPHIDAQKPLPCVITRYSGKHFGRIMGEYVISSIVNHERNVPQVMRNQHAKVWNQEGRIGSYRTISDLTIGILGIGSIGNKVGRLLHNLGGNIIGLGRRASIDNNKDTDYLLKYFNKDSLDEFLKLCDYIINILPSTPETIGLLNGGILENCKNKSAVFINIGRGSIVSDEDLITSLNKKWLSAAILDVFNTEPLPEESPLWSMSQVTITPHCSGMSRSKDIAEQFTEFYFLYQNGKVIPTALKIGVGY